MSKRWGRNQRRRAREEQARLGEALEMAQGLARHLSEQKRHIEDELDDAKYFAVRFSAAFKPESWELVGPKRDRIEVEEQQPLEYDFSATAPMQSLTFRRLPLRMLLSEVKQEHFRRALHCRVKFGDGEWGYGITEQAIVNMPRERLVNLISREIARQIANKIK
jgi:hypothetical protein